MAYITFILMLAAAIGGTLSYKANAALPGDPLYAYKIGVNEKIERGFAHTDTAAASWDLFLLQERLTEARTLAKHGKLNTQTQTTVTQNINEHVRNLTVTIDKFQTEGNYHDATLIMSKLHETLLNETQQVANQSLNASPTQQISLAPILVKLRTTLNTVTLLSTKLQAKAPGQNAPSRITNVTAAAESAFRE